MAPTDLSLEAFIRIYKEKFNEDISPEEARIMAAEFLSLYELLYVRLDQLSKDPGGR
ncbi:hypothetical protein [uncultured Sneathiella sp.]|uniref:hypothetical protein n=1 Tax=uncultured Sneathiella sp. TaxID=879315 RepID=UPI0030D9CF0A